MTHITVLAPDPSVPLDRFDTWLTEAGATFQIINLSSEGIPESVGDGVIILGGINDARSYPWVGDLHTALREWASANIPVLGICLGAQLLADAHDGDLDFDLEGEVGAFEVELMDAAHDDPLFLGLESPLIVPQHHHDVIITLPPGAELLAASQRYEVQAFRLGSAVGVQFHPEASPGTMASWTEKTGGDGEAMRSEMAKVDDRVSATGERIARNFVTSLQHHR
ncbi:type 1 glutamine amidotransferase [Corynebacterium sp.]|uniref:type 1 glutamine amidotransferase n=1 Tax=Corynebacterium sp. TaxID=1720 RepID=UPI0026E01E3D|nr:type 1 glutamine amidotransferase [Corynebacterium sp.]MDO5511553.1 type 1 glutamine amidotransferase [Corynebacterium sp.]